jgi:hypothetical protein
VELPDPCSLCPLSSTEFAEPSPEKISGLTPPQEKIPGYATDYVKYVTNHVYM